MADAYEGGFVRDQATDALVVIGPSGGDIATGRLLATGQKSDSTFTTTSSFADVTGLTAITFTVPASGAVIVEAVCTAYNDTLAQLAVIKIVDNSGAVDICQSASSYAAVASQQSNLVAKRRVTGLTPGAAKSYKLQAGRSISASGNANFIASTAQPIVVTIHAA